MSRGLFRERFGIYSSHPTLPPPTKLTHLPGGGVGDGDSELLRHFEEVVDRALDSLPDHLADAVSNVQIVIEHEHPTDRHIYGYYSGIPLTQRGPGYAGVLPDKISIYRTPLHEDFGHDPELLEEEIRITVLHELAHHFGVDEDRLDELGWS